MKPNWKFLNLYILHMDFLFSSMFDRKICSNSPLFSTSGKLNVKKYQLIIKIVVLLPLARIWNIRTEYSLHQWWITAIAVRCQMAKPFSILSASPDDNQYFNYWRRRRRYCRSHRHIISHCYIICCDGISPAMTNKIYEVIGILSWRITSFFCVNKLRKINSWDSRICALCTHGNMPNAFADIAKPWNFI